MINGTGTISGLAGGVKLCSSPGNKLIYGILTENTSCLVSKNQCVRMLNKVFWIVINLTSNSQHQPSTSTSWWIVSNHQHQLKSLFQHQIVNKAFWILSLGFSYSRNTSCRVDTQQTSQDPLLLAPPYQLLLWFPFLAVPLYLYLPKLPMSFFIFLFFSANKNMNSSFLLRGIHTILIVWSVASPGHGKLRWGSGRSYLMLGMDGGDISWWMLMMISYD